MKYILSIAIIGVLIAAPPQADASTNPEKLVESCVELVNIYKKRDEMRFAAAQTTSLSEAMRAGYCRGVLDEFQRSYRCHTDDWLSQAATIASHAFENPIDLDADTLLTEACGY